MSVNEAVPQAKKCASHIEQRLALREKEAADCLEKHRMQSVSISAFLRAIYFSYKNALVLADNFWE